MGTRRDLDQGARLVGHVGEVEVGVILHAGRLHAFENRCLHQGGPVCEGTVIGKVEAVLSDDKEMLGERFSSTEIHLVCPWHGYEYDLETGECATDRRLRLRRYEVIERDGEVYVLA
jgi:nitrite reductase/ring-hydroxylating ferredoxin subunit